MEGHVPELWNREGPTLQTDFLVREKIVNWLGEISGLNILDAGCGEGYVSRKLCEAGAIVDSFDIDEKMIELAQKRNKSERNKINYKIGDIIKIDKIYPNNKFDIVVISGVICFLKEKELFEVIKKVTKVIKPNGRILIATNHTDSYFKGAKSKWLEYLTKPDKSLPTQEVKLNFNNSKGEHIFTGVCYFHTPEQVKKALESANFKILEIHEPLSTKTDMVHFSSMWIDEEKIPYHLVIIAQKERG